MLITDWSTSYKSIVYYNLREAVSNQTDYGGKVHKLSYVKFLL